MESRSLIGTAGVTYAGVGLSLISTPLLARAIGAEGRGELAASWAALQALEFALMLGLPRGLSLMVAHERPLSRRGVATLFGISVLGTAGLLVVAEVVGRDNPTVLWGARGVAILCPLIGLGQLGGQILLLGGRMSAFNLYRSFPLLVPSLATIMAYPLGQMTFEVAYWSLFTSAVISGLVGTWFIIPHLRTSQLSVPTPWKASLNYWSAVALDSVGRRIDLLAGALLLSQSQLGVYAIAATLALAASGFGQALVLTSLSSYVHHSRAGTKRELDDAHPLLLLGLSTSAGIAVTLSAVALDTVVFGTAFGNLGAVTGVLCLAQVAKDWFGWFVEAHTIDTTSHGLNLAGAFGLAVFALAVVALALTEHLSDTTLAIAGVAFAYSRLAVKATRASRSGRTRRSAEAAPPVD